MKSETMIEKSRFLVAMLHRNDNYYQLHTTNITKYLV